LNRTSFRVRPSRSTILRLLSSSAKASNTNPIYIRNSFKQTSYPLGSSEKRARELQEPQRYNSFKGELSVSLQTQEEVSYVCPWSVRPVPVGSRVELESESTTAAHPGKPQAQAQAQAQAVCGSVLYLYGTEPSTHATIASTSSKRAHRESCPVSSAHLLPLCLASGGMPLPPRAPVVRNNGALFARLQRSAWGDMTNCIRPESGLRNSHSHGALWIFSAFARIETTKFLR